MENTQLEMGKEVSESSEDNVSVKDDGYPHWTKGPINWRLHVSSDMFFAAKTKEAAYERVHRRYELPSLEEIRE